MKKNILFIMIMLSTLIMSIGYASLNGVSLNLTGNVFLQTKQEIFISEVTYNNGVSINKEESNIINANQTVLASYVSLSTTDPNSSISYDVIIWNNTEETYEYDETTHLDYIDIYDNENIVYNTSIVDTVLEPNTSITITLTFSYKDATLAPENTLNSNLTFKFKKQYTITYQNITNNNYPSTIKEGETLQIEFTENAPQSLEISMNDEKISNYTYENNILTINNITGNLIIEGKTLDDFDYVFTEDNTTIVNPDTSTTINIADILNSSYGGVNNSEKIISEISVVLNYTTTTGSSQSIDMVLTTGENSYRETINFTKQNSGQDITITFSNLNINTNENFTISYDEPNLNNQKIEIVQKSISIVFKE